MDEVSWKRTGNPAEARVSELIENLKNLQENGDSSSCKAALANLRRGLGKHPGQVPEVWSLIFGGLYNRVDEAKRRQYFPDDGSPSHLELAVYTAVTLFALHQQGHDIVEDCMSVPGQGLGLAVTLFAVPQQGHDIVKDCMSVPGKGLGAAVKSLVAGNDAEARARVARVWRRFCPILKANTLEAAVYHLRSLVQLLRSKGIGFDYPQFAGELYRFQDPDKRYNVCLGWGRQFHCIAVSDEDKEQL